MDRGDRGEESPLVPRYLFPLRVLCGETNIAPQQQDLTSWHRELSPMLSSDIPVQGLGRPYRTTGYRVHGIERHKRHSNAARTAYFDLRGKSCVLSPSFTTADRVVLVLY